MTASPGKSLMRPMRSSRAPTVEAPLERGTEVVSQRFFLLVVMRGLARRPLSPGVLSIVGGVIHKSVKRLASRWALRPHSPFDRHYSRRFPPTRPIPPLRPPYARMLYALSPPRASSDCAASCHFLVIAKSYPQGVGWDASQNVETGWRLRRSLRISRDAMRQARENVCRSTETTARSKPKTVPRERGSGSG